MPMVFSSAPFDRRPRLVAPDARRSTIGARCGRCRLEYAESVWSGLEIVDRLAPARIRTLVTSWPDDVTIEIRRCRACQGVIARKAATVHS